MIGRPHPEAELAEYNRAILNILDDFSAERTRLRDTQVAALNVLEDSAAEKARLEEAQRAVLNIVEDFADEKQRLEATQRAVLNVLEDFAAERVRLEAAQLAVLNILEDFDVERTKVDAVNRELTREVAERRHAERALLEKTEALRRSNEELEQFAYVASHDLQEPLRMVAAYVQLLARRYEGQTDEKTERYIRYAVDGAKRMQALIGALLDYSRIGREMAHGRVNMERVLDRALANLALAIEESDTTVTRDALPEVKGDAGLLVQVFQNLIANAIKFRRPDLPPRVHVSVARRAAELVFTVRDNGIGIDPVQADRLFVLFRRLHTRDEYPGTGIGLAVSKKVIERHGGRIWVQSEAGRGATFFFALPLAKFS